MESGTINPATLRDLEVLVGRGITDGFYLAGGTGLATHLGHRESHDLDFFSETPFNEDSLIKRLVDVGPFALEKKESGTVRGTFHDTLVSFFHYPYPLLAEAVPAFGVPVALVQDIACMKLDALASRGAKRDFVDIYMIIQKAEFSLPRLFELFEKKYTGIHYNLMHIKKGLVYFADAEREPMPLMSDPVAWETVKEFFLTESRKL